MVMFGQDNDYNVEVICLIWVNMNCFVFGYSDGLIMLWLVYFKMLLQCYGVYMIYVIDICLVYLLNLYLVVFVFVGGCVILIDMLYFSFEFIYFLVLVISFQFNLFCWNELM